MTLMKRDRPYLPHDFFVDRFISGLKEGIKHTVPCQKPTTLLSAYWYARQYEKAYMSTNKKPIAQPPITRNLTPRKPLPPRDTRNRVIGDRIREPKEC